MSQIRVRRLTLEYEPCCMPTCPISAAEWRLTFFQWSELERTDATGCVVARLAMEDGPSIIMSSTCSPYVSYVSQVCPRLYDTRATVEKTSAGTQDLRTRRHFLGSPMPLRRNVTGHNRLLSDSPLFHWNIKRSEHCAPTLIRFHWRS
jgi:hypothetical protein